MMLKEDLQSELKDIFGSQWSTTDGRTVPESTDIGLGNEAVKLDAVVLYADLDESTALVQGFKPHFAAEIYKAFLRCAAKIVRAEGGTITAYDGDRIMAVFLGDAKNTSAARAALKLNYARIYLLDPALKAQYPQTTYAFKHTVGIDSSTLHVARTGIRGSNDLVWVGTAANYAAKLTNLSATYPSRITKVVYDQLNDSLKKSSDGRPMWEAVKWETTGQDIYRSTWWWNL